MNDSIPTETKETNTERRRWINAIFIPALLCFLMILCHVLQVGMDWDFTKGGIFPRDWSSLGGVFSYVFIHIGWGHLFNNIVSFALLSSCLFYFYKEFALQVLIISWISGGLLLWIIGRDVWHIGASGWVYALAFFLFFSGIFRRHIPLIAISLIIVFNYGNIVWHIFPWEVNDPISWEGHLSGAIVGLTLSLIYRNKGPQKPVKIWEDDWEEDLEDISGEEDEEDENKKLDRRETNES